MITARSAQARTPITVIFMLFGFILVLAFWAGEQINYWANQAIVNNELTGVTAFAFANINLWLILVVLIAIVAIFYSFGGRA